MFRLSIVLVIASCMPTYSFQRPPLPAADPSDAARCYQAKRFALTSGTATWRKQYGSGNYIITDTYGAEGVAIYRGGELQLAPVALEMMPDRELARAYDMELERTDHDHTWYPRYRNLAFGMALGGLAAAGVGLGVVLQDPNTDLLWPIVGVSTGLALLSIIPTILASKTYDGAVDHDLATTMFNRREWGGRFAASARAANQRAADDCHYAADLPMTDGARALLGN
jgi:hypothetical protein